MPNTGADGKAITDRNLLNHERAPLRRGFSMSAFGRNQPLTWLYTQRLVVTLSGHPVPLIENLIMLILAGIYTY
jgi:hypothetical protein